MRNYYQQTGKDKLQSTRDYDIQYPNRRSKLSIFNHYNQPEPFNTKSFAMPNSKSKRDPINDEKIYVIEQTSDMELEDFVEKIKIKVQQVLSETSNDPKYTN